MNENTEEVVAPTTETTAPVETDNVPTEAAEKLDSEVDNNAPVDTVEDTEEAVADEDLTEDNEAATANATE